MDSRQEVITAQQTFWDALKRKDRQGYERVIAEDFVLVGRVNRPRDMFIEQLSTFPAETLAIESDGIQVHFVGETAVLTGVQMAHLRLPDGREVYEALVITNLFRYENNQWRLVLSHPASANAEDETTA